MPNILAATARCVALGIVVGELAACTTASDPEVRPLTPTEITLPTLPPADPTPEDIAAAARKRLEGLEARKRGDLPGAIAAFEAAVASDPTHLDGGVILGWTLHLDGQHAQAIAVLDEVLARDESYVPALNALGIAHLVGGDLDVAVTTHERAAELDPNNEIAYYNLSLAYERLQQFDRAIATATRATELEPNNPHPWVALALAHWSAGDPNSARSAYRQAIALDVRYRQESYLDHLLQAGFVSEQLPRVRSLQAATLAAR